MGKIATGSGVTEFLRVIHSEWAAIQDLGRTGVSKLGVSANGAADQYSARMANALLGKDQAEPLIEITGRPFKFSVTRATTIAVTGARSSVRVDNRPIPQWRPTRVTGGQVVEIGAPLIGLRTYVAVRAELVVTEFLKSSAPDPALGFGQFLRSADCVEMKLLDGHPDPDSLLTSRIDPNYRSPWILDVCRGPEWDRFLTSRDRLLASTYTVASDSNHVGIRLHGSIPDSEYLPELESRGVSIGAIEVTPARELLLLHRGRSITAGYPVLAVVTSATISAAGQMQPGDEVRFRSCNERVARLEYLRQRRVLDSIEGAAVESLRLAAIRRRRP